MTATGLLLCTDLDRTLLPNGAEPESARARSLFARLVDRTTVTLVYVSGRDQGLVEEAIAEFGLPLPDHTITDVGTRILSRRQEKWREWRDWENEIGSDWGDHDAMALAGLFADLKSLRLQESARQKIHKLSYYLPMDCHTQRLDEEIQQRLQLRGVRARLVWSVDEPAGVALLDVLPARASKLHAIEFLCVRLGFTQQHTLFAGDSGNDLAVMVSGIPCVLVANATAEVREAARAGASAAGHEHSLYLARGGYLGLNGNYSAGILEGLAHFYPEYAQQWVETS